MVMCSLTCFDCRPKTKVVLQIISRSLEYLVFSFAKIVSEIPNMLTP